VAPTVTEPVTPVTEDRYERDATVTEAVTPAVTTVTVEQGKAPSTGHSAGVTVPVGLPARDPALIGVYALIEGLQRGRDELARLGFEGKAARLAARQERRQETRTKTTAFVLFVLMSALLVGAMWAGAHG